MTDQPLTTQSGGGLELEGGDGVLLVQQPADDPAGVPVAWLASNGPGGWEAEPGG